MFRTALSLALFSAFSTIGLADDHKNLHELELAGKAKALEVFAQHVEGPYTIKSIETFSPKDESTDHPEADVGVKVKFQDLGCSNERAVVVTIQGLKSGHFYGFGVTACDAN